MTSRKPWHRKIKNEPPEKLVFAARERAALLESDKDFILWIAERHEETIRWMKDHAEYIPAYEMEAEQRVMDTILAYVVDQGLLAGDVEISPALQKLIDDRARVLDTVEKRDKNTKVNREVGQ